MRYRLRTLLIVLLVLPPLIAFFWPRPRRAVPIKTVPEGATAEVDLIQVHEFCDSQGKPIFKQLLFWSRYPNEELHVREWRLIGSTSMRNFQIKNPGDADCECSWTEFGVERRVRSPALQKSKSVEDPELTDRKKLPKPSRTPLWR